MTCRCNPRPPSLTVSHPPPPRGVQFAASDRMAPSGWGSIAYNTLGGMSLHRTPRKHRTLPSHPRTAPTQPIPLYKGASPLQQAAPSRPPQSLPYSYTLAAPMGTISLRPTPQRKRPPDQSHSFHPYRAALWLTESPHTAGPQPTTTAHGKRRMTRPLTQRAPSRGCRAHALTRQVPPRGAPEKHGRPGTARSSLYTVREPSKPLPGGFNPRR